MKTKTVILEHQQLHGAIIERMKREPGYNSILDDLVVFTGLSEVEVIERVLRSPETHFKSEFRWQSPRDRAELKWYYCSGQGYLFANAAHPYWTKLDFLEPWHGPVLDYGAGVGSNVITLAKRGIMVDYLEISIIEEAFARFRVKLHQLNGVEFVSHRSRLTFVITPPKVYGVIILQDVLEHIPDYHVLLKDLISYHLKVGGYIIESSPFNPAAGEIAIHLKAEVPLAQAMNENGMEQIETGIWQKIGGQQTP